MKIGFLFLAAFMLSAFASAPPSNTIPIIAMKAGQEATVEDISIESLSLLSWHYFDGAWLEAWPYWDPMEKAMALCDSTGMWFVISDPWLGNLGDIWCGNAWSRYYPKALSSDCAFIRTDTAGTVIVDSIDADSLHEEIIWRCDSIIGDESAWETLWYCDTWNEAPAWQRNRMVLAEDSLDGYVPSMFTMDSSMSEVGTTSTWSWLSYIADSIDIGHPVSLTFSTMHRIQLGEWADYQTPNYGFAPTFHTQANSVRAYINMEYQKYSSPPLPEPVENRPEILGYNAYPFRQVGILWQEDNDSTVILGDELNTWMLEHYEEGLDSTIVIAASEDHFKVHYHPQSFGICGGEALWIVDTTEIPPDTVIGFSSYRYRLPSPAEFRMLCSLALLRQAKGIFPYSARGYSEPGLYCAGLLDEDLIPYDAPYEDWVYGERETSDYNCAPPDSFPPFLEGYDPLFELAPRPTTSGERSVQDYLEWKFEPYANLWNSLRATLGEIATVAPELSGLWWWDGYENAAEIAHPDTTLPVLYLGPEIRVFTDNSAEHAWFCYVNRFCREDNCEFVVSADEDDFPEGALTAYALDHGRRFVIPVDVRQGIHSYADTLEAGQVRLVEFVGEEVPAEIRITRPDVYVDPGGQQLPVRDFRFTAGEEIDIRAVFYNMGTERIGKVQTELYDLTRDESIATDSISLSGLSTDGYECASAMAAYVWQTSAGDIGIHRLSIGAEAVSGEDELDNETTVLFLIEPRDYATAVLDAPWDMNEATLNPPAWKTADIDSLWGYQTTFTDSISGMFEGTVRSDSGTTNRLYLHTVANSPIDGDTWNQFSLACHAGGACDVVLGWTDSQHGTGSIQVGRADEGWTILVPCDLSDTWSGKDIAELWLRFEPDGQGALPVRIGWVKLTEQEEGR